MREYFEAKKYCREHSSISISHQNNYFFACSLYRFSLNFIINECMKESVYGGVLTAIETAIG